MLRQQSTQICSLAILAMLLAGCQTLGMRPAKTDPVAIHHPEATLTEGRLLDVWIELFAPGPGLSEQDRKLGITPEIRRAESRFVPVHLKKTLQQTGYWGAVRVVPQGTQGGDLQISGRILQSDGELLNVEIDAIDSTGRHWLTKEYTAVADVDDYRDISEGKFDAFQDLYNAIANDLARVKQGKTQESLTTIRRVTELRFAGTLVPDAYSKHLAVVQGQYRVRRLPARDDPMMQRVSLIRERDYLFIDTLNDYYDGFYRDSWDPYSDWRRFRSEEAENLRQVESDAMTRKVVGIGAIVGAVALSMAGSSDLRANTSTLRQLMLIGGVMATKSGFDKDKEKQIHIDAMEELGTSFDSEVAPMVVEVDGETHRLTGSAETQYAKWRGLLQQIHQSENALPDIELPPQNVVGNAARSYPAR